MRHSCFLFIIGSALTLSAHAVSFQETDVGAIRAHARQVEEDALVRDHARIVHQNQVLLNLIAPFARQHQGVSGEPACNGRPYPLIIGNEPWTDFRPLNSIDPQEVWEIMNCDVNVGDGYRCTLNYHSRDPAHEGPAFHCQRGEEDRDFRVRDAGKKSRR